MEESPARCEAMELEKEATKDFVLLLIRNIPLQFHSKDLRAFFSSAIEQDTFACFQYRHRPEKIDESTFKDPESAKSQSVGSSEASKKEKKTFCCFVKVRSVRISELVRYNGQNWTSEKQQLLPSRCHIVHIKMAGDVEGTAEARMLKQSSKYLTRAERRAEQQYHLQFQSLREADVDALIEMKPPPLFPQGNVGTPTKYFLQLIQRCSMPSSLIGRLGLKFPKGLKNRKFGQVSFDYGSERRYDGGEGDDEEEEEGNNEIPRVDSSFDESHQPLVWFEKKKHGDNAQGEDELEDWERYEASNDDVTTHERNKERLFEDEAEVVWEKGGPGIVWNMDANFWKEQAGGSDLDEATDDFDVDTSQYYEPESDRPGDKDARDYMQIRRESTMRGGTSGSLFRQSAPGTSSRKVSEGEFGKYGIGQHVLEKHGWTKGEGVGKWRKGIVDPLEGEGQLPHQKQGLGFYGDALSRRGPPDRGRQMPEISRQAMLEPGQSGVLITSKYDAKDTGDTLKQRADHSRLKYRPAPY
ncbi:hypothetical protein RvY_08994 [Ramazzottius varieornatus]|uniref:G-patch domain-containing protein n=1 Tax=Ramazzottius varieornatus TaxID=947166 RepID=A0A1D1V7X8_RAMVA|nr:hypothetical protein RvY_08994 [Ramazzottius varieornatus]